MGRTRAAAWWLPVDGGTVRRCVPRSPTEAGRQVARRGAAYSVQKCDAGQGRAGQDGTG